MIDADRVVGHDLQPRIETGHDLRREFLRVAGDHGLDPGRHGDDVFGRMLTVLGVENGLVMARGARLRRGRKLAGDPENGFVQGILL